MVYRNFFGQPPFMQDFANYRDDRHIEVSQAPGAEWSPDLPSLVFGILIGLFVAVVSLKVAEYRSAQAALIPELLTEEANIEPFKLDFYEALKVYEVLPRNSDQD